MKPALEPRVHSRIAWQQNLDQVVTGRTEYAPKTHQEERGSLPCRLWLECCHQRW
jgi:hypothetical protein